MFNFELPKLTKQIDIKRLSRFLTVVYFLSILPLLIMAHFNWPSADDLSMAYRTHKHFQETGSVFGTLLYAIPVAYEQYMTWIGYYFSAMFTNFCPSIFGEKWYFLTTYIVLFMLTFGAYYFFDALLVKALGSDKYLSRSLCFLTLMVIVHCMEEGTTRVEAFYWYSGAINYMFMFGFGMLWIGLIIRAVFDKDSSSRKRKLILSSVLGLCLGGANYLTALELFICSFLILIIIAFHKTGKLTIDVDGDADRIKSFGLLWIPAVLNIIGFIVSCLAPGNSIRGGSLDSPGPIKSILIGLYYSLTICLGTFTRWEMLVFLVFVAMISWKIASGIKHEFKHPFVFAVFVYGMVSASMVPPIYAAGSVEAGRIRSIVWSGYVVIMTFAVFYLTVWARQKLTKAGTVENVEGGRIGANMTFMFLMCTLFLAFGSELCIGVDKHYYTGTSAIYEVMTGKASAYRAENLERLELLMDDSLENVVLKPHSDAPVLLFFADITRDEDDWINKAAAKYYDKESVVLGD